MSIEKQNKKQRITISKKGNYIIDMLINLIVVVTLKCIGILHYHTLYPKYIILFINYTPIKPGEWREKEITRFSITIVFQNLENIKCI